MATKTIPALQMRVTLDADDGPHLRVTYADASTDDITLGASGGTPYWPLASGGIDDLLAVLEAALTSGASGSWSVNLLTPAPWGRVLIVQDASPPKVATSIEWLTDELTPRNLGLAASGTTTALTDVGGARLVTGPYRMRWIYSPDVICTEDDPDTEHEIVQLDLPTGPAVVDDYGGREVRRVLIPFVEAGMLKAEYTADADYNARLKSISTSDPNAALGAWLEALRDRVGGAAPRLRWVVDRATPSGYVLCTLATGDLYGSVRAWVGEPVVRETTVYHLSVELVERAS